MPIVVLVILAACWAVVLVPPMLRARTERSTDPITDFNFRLGVLGRARYRYFWGFRPLPAGLELALHKLRWRR